MKMNRRRFLKIAAGSLGGALACGGAAFVLKGDSNILEDHWEGTEKVLAARFGKEQGAKLLREIRHENESLAREMPYIGGETNMFTEWLIYGVYYLAMYRVLKGHGRTVEEAGRLIYDIFTAMAEHPEWLLRLVGRFRYDEDYVSRLKRAAEETQARRYDGDWVAAFVKGDGQTFDYGLDIAECGIHKLYRRYGAEEVAPYLCLSDYVLSKAFNRGLVRHNTLAEGADLCDFRFKSGRDTFVNPLRDGWPPRFATRGA